MKTFLFTLVGAFMLSTTYASDYIVIRIYDIRGGLIVISREEAEKQKIAHLPRGIEIKFKDLKDYGVAGVYGREIREEELAIYLDQSIVAK